MSDSSSEKPRGHYHHERAASSPIEFQEDLIVGKIQKRGHLPTLPRFPVLKNKNCWSEPENSYKVRGPGYFVDGKKVASGKYLLRARGCDLFLTSENVVQQQ
jgi:hypothetical protein